MSVERLTKREKLAGHNIAYVSDKNCFDVWSVPKKFMGNAIERLAQIEDILGDNYELDRLRELVEEDKDRMCVKHAQIDRCDECRSFVYRGLQKED